MSSGRYHQPAPVWEDVALDEPTTEPPPPEAMAYERIARQANDEAEAIRLDYLVKAYRRMDDTNRVLLIEIAKRLDPAKMIEEIP